MDQIFNNSAQQTTIGVKAYSAVCQPTTEEVDGGKNLKYHNQYLVELANGDALLFEVQWFEENKNFKETKATGESEDTAETESVRETEETVKGTETAADSSKEVVAESASKKLSEMLDSIEIEVSVKGEEPAEALETVLESAVCSVIQCEFQELLGLRHCLTGFDLNHSEIRLAECLKVYIICKQRLDFHLGKINLYAWRGHGCSLCRTIYRCFFGFVFSPLWFQGLHCGEQ